MPTPEGWSTPGEAAEALRQQREGMARNSYSGSSPQKSSTFGKIVKITALVMLVLMLLALLLGG